MQAMLRYLAPYASVVVWVLFNEGWGQADTKDLRGLIQTNKLSVIWWFTAPGPWQETVALVQAMDDGRLVNVSWLVPTFRSATSFSLGRQWMERPGCRALHRYPQLRGLSVVTPYFPSYKTDLGKPLWANCYANAMNDFDVTLAPLCETGRQLLNFRFIA